MTLGDHSLCRVCGYKNEGPAEDYPWGSEGDTPRYTFCPCCGVESGYGDATQAAVRKSRDAWMQSGYNWDAPDSKPPGWTPETQLARLKGSLWDPWA